MKAQHVVHRNGRVFRHIWRRSAFFSFVTPLLFLGAMGIGLGTLVQSGSGVDMLGGISYLAFIAPGLLAATAMQTGSFEASFPILNKISWQRNYEAILSTPLEVSDVVLGELGWIALRIGGVSTAFLVVITSFGVPQTPLAILAVPAAMLTGTATASAVIGFSATRRNASEFSNLFRFVITPMFLFSGTFFPIEQIPSAVRWIAYITPLYHGVALSRGLVLNRISTIAAIPHLLYLTVFLLLGTWIGLTAMRKRMVT